LGTVVDALQSGLELGAVALDLAQEPERVLLLTGHPGEVVEDGLYADIGIKSTMPRFGLCRGGREGPAIALVREC
jgi:hypothetical protein